MLRLRPVDGKGGAKSGESENTNLVIKEVDFFLPFTLIDSTAPSSEVTSSSN